MKRVSGTSPVRRVLIPYFRAGGGHLAIAAALEQELLGRRPEWDVRLMEPADVLHDAGLDAYYRASWKAILRLPRPINRALFAVERGLPALPRTSNQLALRKAVPKAAGYLAGYQPDLVLATHWGCAHLFAAGRRLSRSPARLFSIYTELGGGYAVLACGADRYFAMSAAAEQGLVAAGAPAPRVQRVRPIVRPGFTLSPPANARAALKLPEKGLVVLFNTGGEGISRPHPFISAYLANVPEGVLLLAAGRNERLRQEVADRFPPHRVRALGFRRDIDTLMAASDLVAGKCGTAYVLEAQATGVPFIGTLVGAPTERPNIAHAVNHGYGWYAPTPQIFGRLLAGLWRTPDRLQAARARLAQAPSAAGSSDVADAIEQALA